MFNLFNISFSQIEPNIFQFCHFFTLNIRFSLFIFLIISALFSINSLLFCSFNFSFFIISSSCFLVIATAFF